MKKLFLILSVLVFVNTAVLAAETGVVTYCEKNKFGLKSAAGEIITEANFKKLIRVGDSSWIVQKGTKFGLIDNDGNYIVEPRYNTVERIAGRFVKFGKGSVYGLYNQHGEVIVPQEYSSIDLLYGKMFMVGKNYKYGLIGYDGREILQPVADDIYMPKPNIMEIQYNGKWYQIEQIVGEDFALPENIRMVKEDKNFKITEFISDPVTSAGYGVVSAGDYFIKIFSSISPAYENTIDELVLNHGADVAGILMKSSWLVKFPFVYAKNYFNTIKAPNNGPLSEVKANLKNKIKEDVQ